MLNSREAMEGITFLQDIFPEITAEEKGNNRLEIGLITKGFDEYKKRVAITKACGLCHTQCVFDSNGFLEGTEQIQQDIAVCTGILPDKSAILITKREVSLPVLIHTSPCGKRLQIALEQDTTLNLSRN